MDSFFGCYGYGTLGDIIEDTSEKGDRVIIVKDIIIDMNFTEVCKDIPVSVVKIPIRKGFSWVRVVDRNVNGKMVTTTKVTIYLPIKVKKERGVANGKINVSEGTGGRMKVGFRIIIKEAKVVSIYNTLN